ncbi:MAG: AIPR family protein [Patescibacteria group bacterium]|nr:AIPR family protein [Patescibacteria group bacterium]
MNSTEKATLVRFPVLSFRKIESPYEVISEPGLHSIEGAKSYMIVVNIKDLPDEFKNWRKINPRDPNLNSGVSRKIAQTLENSPDTFFFRNRGLTVLADRVCFDNQGNVVEIEFTDRAKNGLLDGGHSYVVIKNFLEGLSEEELDDFEAYIKIEVIEGINDPEAVVSVVESRNTSIQVKEQSIQELLKLYELIKKTLKGREYEGRISYKEHELTEDGTSKDIDIKEILSYMICFDVEEFDDRVHPIKTYTTKNALLEHYRKHYRRMQKYISLLPAILELHDYIYLRLPGAYNSTGGKFGSLTGVIEVTNKKRMKKITLPFTSRESSYRIPSGFIYPVLAAFRNLVKNDNNRCSWVTDPFKLFDDLKVDLAQRVGEQAKELRNPNKLGKDNATWRGCYDVVQLEILKKNIK